MRILKIKAKCSDMCHTEYIVDGRLQAESHGYPPNLEGLYKGDYIDLQIDVDTGMILGWGVTRKDLMKEIWEDDFK